MSKLLKVYRNLLETQQIHIHNYGTGSKSGQSSSSSSPDSGSGETGSTDTSQASTQNASSSQSNQTSQGLDSQTNQGLQKQNTQRQVGKMMDSRQPETKKKKDEKSMKDFKEVFVRNHVRKYKRKPSIGLMKQTFGTHS